MKRLLNFLRSLSLYFQNTPITGWDYGIKFTWGGRRIFFFHSFMGWHNLSEAHTSARCSDPAYCPWHGSL